MNHHRAEPPTIDEEEIMIKVQGVAVDRDGNRRMVSAQGWSRQSALTTLAGRVRADEQILSHTVEVVSR